MTLSFPWYIYPKTPMSGYHELEDYKNNLVELYQLIKKLSKQSLNNTLLHITIGAALEEQFNKTGSFPADYQWKQLFPTHLENFLETNQSNKIIHIIISPNQSFDQNSFQEPDFVKQTQTKMKWIRRDNYLWSPDFNIEVYIFYTMMPTCDSRNSSIILKMTEKNFGSFMNIQNYIQTSYDIAFTHKFYNKFNKLFNNIVLNRGFVTCFSFAVFNKLSDNRHLINYVMFSEIKQLFDQNFHKSKKLLCEWEYLESQYTLIPYNYDNVNISYLDQSFSKHDVYHILFDKMDNKMIIQKNQLLSQQKLNLDKSYTSFYQKLFDFKTLNLDKKTFSQYQQEKKDFISIYYKNKEMKFKIIKINGDGDCLFSSIKKSLNLSQSICELRKMVQQFLKTSGFDIILYIKNIDEYQHIFHFDDNKIIDIYHDIMSYSARNPLLKSKLCEYGLQQMCIYGGYLEILALSKLFNISISIIHNQQITQYKYQDIDTIKNIYLYFSTNHYDIAELQ